MDYKGDTFCGLPVIKEISGNCGNNDFWALDQDTGFLNISGTGAMADFISDGLMLLDVRPLKEGISILIVLR